MPAVVCVLSSATPSRGAPVDACMKPALFFYVRNDGRLGNFDTPHFTPLQPFSSQLIPTPVIHATYSCVQSDTGLAYTGQSSGPTRTVGFCKRSEFGVSVRMACKPGSVPCRHGDGHSSGTAIARGLVQSTRMTSRRRPRAEAPSSLYDLAPGGACRAVPVTRNAVGSYPTVSPLPGQAPTVSSLWRFP